MSGQLNTPHGGKLIDLIAGDKKAAELKNKAQDYKSWDLTPRQICDTEMIINGAFSPLTGFMNQADYESVCSDMRLSDSTLWPIPITLDVSEEFGKSLKKGEKVALRDQEGVILAILEVGDVWQPDKAKEAEQVYGANDTAHPAVHHMHNEAHDMYVGGTLTGLELPSYYDFKELRNSPKELRTYFEKMGWTKVVAFQTRNPMHRAHVELTLRAAKQTEANLLIHPVVGMTKPGDIDHYTRVRIYKKLQERYPASTAMISLLPLAMRMGGPREAVWHAIIRKNYGVTHFIVGRDHAGPGKNSKGEDFYGPYDAQKLVEEYKDELGIEIVPFQMMVYVPSKDMYMAIDEVPEGTEFASISGTEQRERLATGRELPEWFTYPEVEQELRRTTKPLHQRGFTVFFTGLSGSGKSTVANALRIKLLEQGDKTVSLLDGDVVRKHLSSELGFSKEHRDLNVLRIGYVASEIAKHGGVAICAPIAPYDKTRKQVRQMVEETNAKFILVHVATSLEVCEERDRKGLYAAARAGKIKEFTGISDPYEEPTDADLVLDTVDTTPEALAQEVLLHLEKEGLLHDEA
ncbi:MAG: bifunctional sulfate adenylyltransferase/adenylylsulfate kinase [Candidatus Saccharibacteria bacterium]|nr:bifunctional sulfate adenylyltransferase/adenylylsulfate kinase [Candidatus Saccharibacteria bacterium]